MCETMSNIPVEESSYILTEDMIDAAMNEQFAYQEDIESEEELSSQDENMDIEQEIQDCSMDNGTENTSSKSHSSRESIIVSPKSCNMDSDARSVLVIETGLAKNGIDGKKPDSINVSKKASSELSTDNSSKIIMSNGNSSCGSVKKLIENQQHQPKLSSKPTVKTKDSSENSNNRLPLLKKILCSKSYDSAVTNNIESIDLCDSETDDFSEDELTEFELIDDELKSVMESNLMAEVGMTVNEQKSSDSNTNKTPENSSPKISVKSMAKMSTNMFNNISKNNYVEENVSNNNKTTEINNKNNSPPDVSSKVKDQVPTTIQINKIAVPHQTFINHQGQKMKCVYVRNPTSLPLVINSNQPSITNKNVKYMITSQGKATPVQLSPIAALTNMTKQNLQSQRTILPKTPKVLPTEPLYQKPTALQNAPPRPYQFHQDQNLDSIIKSLLFYNLKKPYTPIDVLPSTVTYPCIDCGDRFLLQSSLTHHLARRSVNIRFWCRFCAIEIQFFNRCVLLKHLRAHNISIDNIDTTCITFSPISKDLIDKGLVSTFFKDGTSNASFPRDEPVLQKTNGPMIEDPSKMANNNSLAKEKAFPATVNSNQQRFTTIAGQSKSVCFQTNTSVLLKKPICSTAPTSHSTKTIIPPKSQQTPVVQTVHKQTKDLSQVNNKSSPKSFNLLCEQMPRLVNVKQNAQMKTIPPNVVCELGSKKPDVNGVIDENIITSNFEEEEMDIVNLTDDSCNDDFSKGFSSENGKSKSTKIKDVCVSSKSLKRYCTECGIACLNISKHLNGDNRPTDYELTCEVCQLILPTNCALKIHLRIHMKMPPFKCPDCGKDFVSWDELHSHLKFSCGHLAKCVRYLCITCKAHFPSTSILTQHIISKHSRTVFKCSSCSVAFFNKQSLSKHFMTQHPKETFINVDHKQCCLCPDHIVSYDKHVVHVEHHASNHTNMIYGYKCPMCFVVFANKMPFIIHQIKEKGDLDAKDSNKNKSKNIASSKNTSSANQCFESTETTTQVSDSNSDVEEEPEIIRKNIDEISFVAEKDPLSLEGWDNQEQRIKEKREELCIVCKKNSVYLLPGINLNDQSLCCKQCVKPLDENSTKLQIDDIQGFRYFMNNACRNSAESIIKRKRSSPKSIQRSSSFDETKISLGKRRVSDASFNDSSQESGTYMELNSDCVPTKKKSRKKHIKGNIDLSSQAHIQGQVITSKSLDELICSKCEFVADTREVFLDHIITHRSDPNSFQCLECGLCFVVLPSLERHLQMHHGIKDINNYIENNRSSLPQKVLMIEQDANDNQCRVCNQVFDSPSSLDKHFRTHGMAFMRRLGKSP